MRFRGFGCWVGGCGGETFRVTDSVGEGADGGLGLSGIERLLGLECLDRRYD